MAHPIHRAQPLVRMPDMQRKGGGEEAESARRKQSKGWRGGGRTQGWREKNKCVRTNKSDMSRTCKRHIPVSRTCSHTTALPWKPPEQEDMSRITPNRTWSDSRNTRRTPTEPGLILRTLEEHPTEPDLGLRTSFI